MSVRRYCRKKKQIIASPACLKCSERARRRELVKKLRRRRDEEEDDWEDAMEEEG